MKVAEILDALEKNGYKQIQGTYIIWEKPAEGQAWAIQDKAHVVGACAIGQIALNLGVSWTDVESLLDDITGYVDGNYTTLGSRIITLNDERGMTCKEIADQVRKEYAEFLDHDFEGFEAGDRWEVVSASNS